MKKALLILALIVGCTSPGRTNVFVLKSGIAYKVRVEFVVPTKYTTEYPVISRAFENAVIRWAQVVPIDPLFVTKRIYGRRAIQLYIAPGWEKSVPLGTYQRRIRSIMLNSTKLTTYSDAYDVALHELGHAFGLQHVGGPADFDYIITGMIVVFGKDPETELMCPYLTETNKKVGISSLDIELVRANLRNELSW